MVRDAIALEIDDLSAFARALRSALGREAALPGHLGFLNHIARAAGFQNFQHLKAAASSAPRDAGTPPGLFDEKRVGNVRRCFDAQGRMIRWPAKTSLQALAMWVLWSHLPAREEMPERDVNRILDRWHTFGDRALLRRSLIDHGLARRRTDGSAYCRIEAAPPPDARALIRTFAGRDAA